MKRTCVPFSVLLSLLVGISAATISHAQISAVDGYNYYDVNSANFTVDASCLNLSNDGKIEFEYWFTMLDLVQEVRTLFLDTSPNPPATIKGNYRLVKHDFTSQKVGGEHLSWVLLRPNDDIVRPVISITHGGKSGDGAHWTVIKLGVLDLIQRGYAVVFYQSASSINGEAVQAIEEANFLPKCLFNWSPDSDITCLQQAVYFRSQLSLAALQFTRAQSTNYNLDEELQYAVGFSGGGISTLYSVLMEEEDFDHEIINSLGDQKRYSLFPDQELSIKAASTLSGGMVGSGTEGYAFGEKIFQNMRTDTRFLFLHGQDDNAVLPNKGPLGWSNPSATIMGSEIECALDLDQKFKANNITSKAVINCSGDHNLMTFPCDANEDHFGNNIDFATLSPCLKWALAENFDNFNFSDLCDITNVRSAWPELSYMLMQVHDYSKLIAFYFHQDFADSGPNRIADSFVDEVFATKLPTSVIPIDNPKVQEGDFANGHWKISDKCLVQECEALYFNEEGFGDNLVYFGDYLSMNTDNFDLFNTDFTLELEFKAIANKQNGVLISYLKNINQGFEIFVNNNGFLQFKKTIGSPASLISAIDVSDGECHNLALVRKANTFQLYVDGSLEDEKTYNISFTNTKELRIGNTTNEIASGKNGFNGVIRGFRIWNRSLAESELQQKELDPGVENLEADFTFREFSNDKYSSSNGNYNLQFGEEENSVNYDPKWFSDDRFCACQSDISSAIEPGSNLTNNDLVKVYPNPSQGVFTIEWKAVTEGPKRISIYSMDGRLLKSQAFHSANSKFTIEEEGIFLVKIEHSRHHGIRKVVVSRLSE